MFAARLALATALGALAATSCGSDGGTSTGTTSGATATTGASSSSTTDASPTTDTPTTTGSTTQGSSDGTSLSTSSGDATSSTGDSSSGGSTSSASRGTSTSTGSESTGGGMPIAFFDCTELTVVDLQLKEKISGAFDAQGVPLAVLATMVKGGAIDFQIAIAGPVAADDPYAADVAFWEQELTAQGWDVNPPGDPSGDRRYIFIPEGAQFVAKFSLFYYRIYDGGGNGQFEFECIKQ